MKAVASTLATLIERDTLERDASRGAARTAAFIGRPEFFGSIIYDSPLMVPALKLAGFAFTSISDAI